MERNNISDVWLEAQIDENGIALTLISEGVGEDAVVEEVDHYTFEELQDKSGDMFNMNLSDDSRETLSEMRRLSNIGKIAESDIEAKDETESQQGKELPEVGDVMIDENAPDWAATTKEVEVVEVLPDTRCDEYVIQSACESSENSIVELDSQSFSDFNVAEANPSHDESDPVILAKYDGDGDEYAFPVSRLSAEA